LRERTRPGLGIIEPCLPSPAKAPPSGPGWLHEIKHGFRILARRDSAGVRLITPDCFSIDQGGGKRAGCYLSDLYKVVRYTHLIIKQRVRSICYAAIAMRPYLLLVIR
jgi:hypothetical protein